MGCGVSGCKNIEYSSGLCSTHYNRLRTTGTTDAGPKAHLPLKERFWSKVKIRSQHQCWPWIGKSLCRGYGYIGLGSRDAGKELSHRVSWILTNGNIPKGMVVRHICHNRLCCNPKHLLLGTQADNVADMWAREDGPRGNARLTNKQILEIRRDSRSSRRLAPVYGVSHAHIRAIRRKRTWKD